MTVAASMIPGLDEIVRSGDPQRRTEAARLISELFFEDAANLRPVHVALFDGILIDLVPHADLLARVELAERMSLIVNAPRVLVGRLARENEIMVAGPLLRRSPVLDEDTLLEIARVKGQGHLLAMSERPGLSAHLTHGIGGRLWRVDQACQPGRRADPDRRPAQRSLRRPAEATVGRLARRDPPPPLR